MTKKINSMQCGIMLCLTTISLKFLTYPSVFASFSYKDVYVPILIGLILDVSFTFRSRLADVSTKNTKVQKNKKRSFCIFVKIQFICKMFVKSFVKYL